MKKEDGKVNLGNDKTVPTLEVMHNIVMSVLVTDSTIRLRKTEINGVFAHILKVQVRLRINGIRLCGQQLVLQHGGLEELEVNERHQRILIRKEDFLTTCIYG